MLVKTATTAVTALVGSPSTTSTGAKSSAARVRAASTVVTADSAADTSCASQVTV